MENKKIILSDKFTRKEIERRQEEFRAQCNSINRYGILESELAHPAEPDLVTMMKQSHLRNSVYFNRRKTEGHSSLRRESVYMESIELPDYVVCNRIELSDIFWDYKTPTSPCSVMRRVFTEKDQSIQLDIEETLYYLSASFGSPNYEEVKAQLEQEADINNTNNQSILQLMYERVEKGLPILENSKNRLLDKKK